MGATTLQNEHSLSAWHKQVAQAWRAQVSSDPILEAAASYADFLDSMFFYYSENMRAAESATSKG